MSRNTGIAVPKGDILIVDDEPVNLRLLSNMLTMQGYKVRAVTSGAMALTTVRTLTPDLILMDINMPEMSGYEVCTHLKADARARNIPVIFISALDDIQDKVKAFTVGGVDYITKPFQLEEVLARVETHLALRDLQKQLQDANDRLERELLLAGKIQTSFLADECPTIPEWQLSVALKPARETFGDFYDINPLPNGCWGLVIADVVDKGVGAALYMALSCTLIRTYAMEYPLQPELVLKAANRRILIDTQDNNLFVTVFYGILDPKTGVLAYSNAGHNPPYLLRAQGDVVEKLPRTGVPLGLFEDKIWERDTVQLNQGDVLLLYTDGVTDAQNVEGGVFGEDRLVARARVNLGRSAAEIQAATIAGIYEFVGDAPQFDDITLMILIRGNEESKSE